MTKQKSRRKNQLILNQERDVAILIFIWRWRVATTSVLWKKFFPDLKLHTAYRRLNQLENAGYIVTEVDICGKQFAWMLARKGYECILGRLLPLRNPGYVSEAVGHDLLVGAFQYSPYLLSKDPPIIVTQQELRRIDTDEYPNWIYSSDLHIPDGYTAFINGKGLDILAIEIESHRSRKVDYELATEFYRSNYGVKDVLWLAGTKGIVQKINKQIKRHSGDLGKHSILTLKNFSKNGGNAKFEYGKQEGKSVQQLMSNGGSNGPDMFDASLFLNTRKYPINPETCEDFDARMFSDRRR